MSQRPMIRATEPLSGSQRDPFFGHLDLLHRDVFGSTWLPAPVKIGGGSKPYVSVGERSVPVQQPRAVVPQVVPAKYPVPPKNALFEEATRDIAAPDTIIVRGEPKTMKVTSLPGGLFRVVTPDGTVFDSVTRSEADAIGRRVAAQPQSGAAAGNLVIPKAPPGGGITGGPAVQQILGKKQPEKPMDLGNLLNTGLDLYGRYQQIQNLQQPVVYQTVDNPFIPNAIEQFIPGSDVDGNPILIPKKKRCRRRRRRLATKSDLGDLAALKAILGNGEAFKAWIATHSR